LREERITQKTIIMVAIEKNSQARKRSVLDYTLCITATCLFFLVLVVFDTYEYFTVPGAHHARKHIHNGANKVHSSVNSMAALFQDMTKEEKLEMDHEVEEAVELVRKKHDEVEEIVEKVAEMEKEVHNTDAGDSTTTEENDVDEEKAAEEEEKKEEIIEEMVEKELGLENWCGSCRWMGMGFNCDQRVTYMIQKYGLDEVSAKEANIEHCSNKGRRMLRYSA